MRPAVATVLSLAIVPVVGLMLEFFVRITAMEAPALPAVGGVAKFEGIRVDPLLGALPEPGWSGRWESGFEVRFDDRGFRASGFNPPADPTARIAFLGDSCTFGWGIETKRTYVARLDAMQRAVGEPTYELVNAAFPGHSAVVGRHMWSERVAPLEPDVIILAFSANNAFRFSLRRDSQRFRFFAARRIALRSRLFEILSGHFLRLTLDENTRSPRAREGLSEVPLSQIRRVAVLDEFEDAIRTIVTEAQASTTRVILLSLPRAFELSDRYSHEDAGRMARKERAASTLTLPSTGTDPANLALLEISCLDHTKPDAMDRLRDEAAGWLPVASDNLAVANFLKQGSRAYNDGDFETAIDTFARALALEPDSPAAHYELGVAKIAQGHVAAGIENLERADALACSVFLRYQVALWKIGLDLSVPVVDLMLALQPHTNKRLFIDSAHPSRIGHRLIAQAVWPVIVREASAAAAERLRDSR